MKETKQIWNKIWEQERHNGKLEWINNNEKDLQGLEEGLEANIRQESLKAALKKIPNWKTPDHEDIHGLRF